MLTFEEFMDSLGFNHTKTSLTDTLYALYCEIVADKEERSSQDLERTDYTTK